MDKSTALLLLLFLGPTMGRPARAEPPHGAPAHGHDAAQHGGPLVHRFADPARWAKEFDDPARDAWQKPAELTAALQLQAGMAVADLGAGTGYLLPYLCRAVAPGGKVLALDIEASMVRYLEERIGREKLAGATAKQVALDDPQLAEASVDRVVVLDVWHHVPERVAYAKKLLRALRPTGAVYIVDFTKESTHGPPKHHRLTPQAVIAELTAAGLRAEVVSESLPDQYIVVGQRPATARQPGPPGPPGQGAQGK